MFPPPAWDEGLDEAQRQVAWHGREPLVVVAGAGTGKTRALVSRVAGLLARGVAAERVLLLTFTRRAAEEMLARAAYLCGDAQRRPWGGTFHAVGHRFVSAYAPVLGLPAQFGVLGQGEPEDLMDILRAEHGLSGTEARLPRPAVLVHIYSRCINTRRRLPEVLAADFPWCEPHVTEIASLFRAFTERKRAAATVDYDDLMLYWHALLEDPVIGREISGRYDYVLVDEYQDVNGVQADIVRCLSPDGQGLTIVGDEAQSIYGFRGAAPARLREVVSTFPGAQVVALERNFRSRQGILDLANSLRPQGAGERLHLWADRGPGPRARLVRCYDASSEARAIVASVLRHHEEGIALHDQAVLVRAAHHSDLVEVELAARRVPFRKYGGLRFLEAAHVKDFLAAARLVDNPNDELAWFRILRLHEGIGNARARALLPGLTGTTDRVQAWETVVALVPAPARAGLSSTLAGLTDARGRQSGRAGAVLEALRQVIAGHYADPAPRLADLERLAAAGDQATDWRQWLADVALAPPSSTSDLAGPPLLDEDYLVISTVHSAKGLEWPVVHIAHVVDGFIPIDMALGSEEGLDEERRLFYVAVTRARDELELYSPMRMPYHRRALDDLHGYAQASRFLDAGAMAHLAVSDESGDDPRSLAGAGSGRVRVDVDHLWA
ncbi:MAG TPA: ATP-dependent helicase [Acidimicrobiales bacterium]|nr:ATP-dependent helicase [Acidimicrobiales bacterium]